VSRRRPLVKNPVPAGPPGCRRDCPNRDCARVYGALRAARDLGRRDSSA